MSKYTKIAVIFLLLLKFAIPAAYADSELPLPRFASLKSSEVNVRTGPGLRYKTKWVLTKKSMPVEIIAEFEQWRKVRDNEGGEGWVHKSMLSGNRSAIVIGKEKKLIYKDADSKSRPVIYVAPGVIASVMECHLEWCRIKADGNKGWLLRKALWGVYPTEDID